MAGEEEVEEKSDYGPSPSQAQLAIMQVVWDRGEVTVGEVWKTLAEVRPVARTRSRR